MISSLKLNFLKEIKWPGQVDIGTGVSRIGKSSLVFHQSLFQNNVKVAQAETTIVQVHNETKTSFPLGENAKKILNQWLL